MDTLEYTLANWTRWKGWGWGPDWSGPAVTGTYGQVKRRADRDGVWFFRYKGRWCPVQAIRTMVGDFRPGDPALDGYPGDRDLFRDVRVLILVGD